MSEMVNKLNAYLNQAQTENRSQEGQFAVGAAMMGRSVDFTRATELTPEVNEAIDDAFDHHQWDEAQTAASQLVRQALSTAVKMLVKYVPPCPDRTTAIRKIREARMDANSAITHNGRY